MNNSPEDHELLKNVFADAAPEAFRSAMLDATLREVRVRKQARRSNRRLLVSLCGVALLLAAARFLIPVETKTQPGSVRREAFIVHSQPLPAALIAATQVGRVDRVSPVGFDVTEVKTSWANGPFETIGEDKLIRLLAGRAGVLVRRGTFDSQLVMPNAEDQDGWPIQ